MLRSTVIGIVVVLLIAKAATSLRVVWPNSVERSEAVKFAPHAKNFEIRADNGSVEFVGQEDKSADVEVTSVLQASAHDEEAARAALDAMEVTIEGKDADTCKIGWRWKSARQAEWSGSVRFKILAPKKVNVDCDVDNGTVNVNDVSGATKLVSKNGKIESDTAGESLEARTSNGTIDAKYSGPHVQLHTQNGTVSADLSHTRAVDGEIGTQNGTVTVTVGNDTSCKLAASTVNGRVYFPGQKHAWIKRMTKSRSAHETLGEGGGTLKLSVQNGSIKVRHAKTDGDSDDDEDSDESD
jgi:hypothetical protein